MVDSKIASETPTTGSAKKLEIPDRQTGDERPAFIVCPNCGKTYRSPKIADGTSVKCAACNHKFQAVNVGAGDLVESGDSSSSATAQFPEEVSRREVVEFKEAETEKKYLTIRVPRLLVLCIAVVLLLQVVYLAGVVLTDLLGPEPDTSDSVANNTQAVDGEDNQDLQNDNQKVTAEFEIKLEVEPPQKAAQQSREERNRELFNQFLTGVNRAAERQRQQDQQWNQFMNEVSRCKFCGGQGSYSYVDSFGNLQTRTCPSCKGLSNNKLIDERLRR